MEGKVEGSRGRGRPKRKWSDDIEDWLSMSVAKAGRMVEDRQCYREVVGDATSNG